MDEADRDAYLAALAPGADIDHRGTTFTLELLGLLLVALYDPTTNAPCIGNARFDKANFIGDARFDGTTFTSHAQFGEATFTDHARFDGATFTGTARFDGATFTGIARFHRATFNSYARFDGVTITASARFDRATFTGPAWFGEAAFHNRAGFNNAIFNSYARFNNATFAGNTRFDEATFASDARFDEATFNSYAQFDKATFTGSARFENATFNGHTAFEKATFADSALFGWATFGRSVRFNEVAFGSHVVFKEVAFGGDAWFRGAEFDRASQFGPLVCGAQVVLNAAVFRQPVSIEVAAAAVSCVRTRWESTAVLHLRYAELDLRDAVMEFPVTIAARAHPFTGPRRDRELDEAVLSGRDPNVCLVSVGGVDAAHLALQDIDLTSCRFAGAVHLDQLKVDGWCTFGTSPTEWGWGFPYRWSRRNTLVEEHDWRVRAVHRPRQGRGWTTPPEEAQELRPAALAALYRQLRKSLEDGKNEPDAADFYYGECEMRRHDKTRPWGERWLLRGYWALSGYGLRATRALVWLGAAMGVTVATLMLWGLPNEEPKQEATGTVPAGGGKVSFEIDKSDPQNPTGDWHTGERFEKALNVTLNSVVFRSSGQDLTTSGTYIEMGSRVAEPILLGLAVLAVRNRVKR
ncbi:pentapeptide repeat-containing protein [Streptomyces sp. NPDC048210]|uniref:pentapeptide repeat-containing protein n=1 Tax=Streptomyces sp. NPDC048210 TaxID=3156657 RepID=UPI00343DE4C0